MIWLIFYNDHAIISSLYYFENQVSPKSIK